MQELIHLSLNNLIAFIRKIFFNRHTFKRAPRARPFKHKVIHSLNIFPNILNWKNMGLLDIIMTPPQKKKSNENRENGLFRPTLKSQPHSRRVIGEEIEERGHRQFKPTQTAPDI